MSGLELADSIVVGNRIQRRIELALDCGVLPSGTTVKASSSSSTRNVEYTRKNSIRGEITTFSSLKEAR